MAVEVAELDGVAVARVNEASGCMGSVLRCLRWRSAVRQIEGQRQRGLGGVGFGLSMEQLAMDALELAPDGQLGCF